jgi:predicted regulator of amino acid metabolism with ACT domain
MKHHTINNSNYESFFLLYIDNELTAIEKQGVDAFLRENPALVGEFEQIKQTKLQPEAITYMQKHVLYRQEKEEVLPQLPLPQQMHLFSRNTSLKTWYYWAAAVSIGIILGILHFTTNNNAETLITPGMVVEKTNLPVERARTRKNINQVMLASTNKDIPQKIQTVQSHINVAPLKDNDVVTMKENRDSSITIIPTIAATTINNRENINQTNVIHLDKPIITSEAIVTIIATENPVALVEPVVVSPKKGLNKLKAFINKIDNQLDALTSIEPSENERSIKVAAFTIPLKK